VSNRHGSREKISTASAFRSYAANLGDEAILQRSHAAAEGLPVEITFFRATRDTKRRHRSEARSRCAALAPRGEREVERLDLLILGGGGILYDARREPTWRDSDHRQGKGVPVMLTRSAPARSTIPRSDRVRECLEQVEVITVRERSAHGCRGTRRHREIGHRGPRCCQPEPLPAPAEARGPGRRPDHRHVGARAGRGGADLDTASTTAPLPRRRLHGDRFDADVVFVPMERRCSIRSTARGDRLDAARERATVSRASTPRADASLMAAQLRRRHAAAFPVFRGAAGRAVRRPALRRKVSVPRGPEGATPAPTWSMPGASSRTSTSLGTQEIDARAARPSCPTAEALAGDAPSLLKLLMRKKSAVPR